MTAARVNIQYGIFAGEGTGRRLRKVLRQSGYEITKQIKDADVILAHSAGCFWLNESQKSQKLVLIDPPYWPGRTTRERARDRSHANFHFRRHGYSWRRWLERNLWGVYYAVRDMQRTVRIIRYADNFDLESLVKGREVLLVRNRHDDWLTPDLTKLLAASPNLRGVHLLGDHDDINHYPDRYVDLLQSVL